MYSGHLFPNRTHTNTMYVSNINLISANVSGKRGLYFDFFIHSSNVRVCFDCSFAISTSVRYCVSCIDLLRQLNGDRPFCAVSNVATGPGLNRRAIMSLCCHHLDAWLRLCGCGFCMQNLTLQLRSPSVWYLAWRLLQFARMVANHMQSRRWRNP